MRDQPTVKVWDPFVRIGHWLLVLGVLLAFLTAEALPELHETIGYGIGVIVVARIMWGLIGPRHARFTDFVYRPSKVLSYLLDLFAFRARRYLGHSPAGGAMVVALLVLLLTVVTTGVVTDIQRENPISPSAASPLNTAETPTGAEGRSEGEQESLLSEVHGAAANLLLLLVAFHVGGVVVASIAHRENLVRSMITGRKSAHKTSGDTAFELLNGQKR